MYHLWCLLRFWIVFFFGMGFLRRLLGNVVFRGFICLRTLILATFFLGDSLGAGLLGALREGCKKYSQLMTCVNKSSVTEIVVLLILFALLIVFLTFSIGTWFTFCSCNTYFLAHQFSVNYLLKWICTIEKPLFYRYPSGKQSQKPLTGQQISFCSTAWCHIAFCGIIISFTLKYGKYCIP